MAVVLNNLAQLYRLQNRLEEAEPLYRKALSIWEKALGPDHPDVARGLRNLGSCFVQEGKQRGALELFQRSAAIFEKTLGSRHPETLNVLQDLSRAYRASGRNTEANRVRSLLRQANSLH